MNVFVYVFLTWWKACFLTPANIIGILHGVLCGLFLSHIHSVVLKLFLILGPGFVVFFIIIIKYPRTEVETKFSLYACHGYIYGNFVDSIVTHGNLVLPEVCFGIFYIVTPFTLAMMLRRFAIVSYAPNRELDVSDDYSRVHDTPLTTPALPSESINCSICLEPLTENIVKLNNCAHSFHLPCITEWLIRKRECPLCREMTETARLLPTETETSNPV